MLLVAVVDLGEDGSRRKMGDRTDTAFFIFLLTGLIKNTTCTPLSPLCSPQEGWGASGMPPRFMSKIFLASQYVWAACVIQEQLVR